MRTIPLFPCYAYLWYLNCTYGMRECVPYMVEMVPKTMPHLLIQFNRCGIFYTRCRLGYLFFLYDIRVRIPAPIWVPFSIWEGRSLSKHTDSYHALFEWIATHCVVHRGTYLRVNP